MTDNSIVGRVSNYFPLASDGNFLPRYFNEIAIGNTSVCKRYSSASGGYSVADDSSYLVFGSTGYGEFTTAHWERFLPNASVMHITFQATIDFSRADMTRPQTAILFGTPENGFVIMVGWDPDKKVIVTTTGDPGGGGTGDSQTAWVTESEVYPEPPKVYTGSFYLYYPVEGTGIHLDQAPLPFNGPQLESSAPWRIGPGQDSAKDVSVSMTKAFIGWDSDRTMTNQGDLKVSRYWATEGSYILNGEEQTDSTTTHTYTLDARSYPITFKAKEGYIIDRIVYRDLQKDNSFYLSNYPTEYSTYVDVWSTDLYGDNETYISCTFQEAYWTISLTSIGEGTITSNYEISDNKILVKKEDNPSPVRIYLQPDPGYSIQTVEINGTAQAIQEQYEITNIENNLTVYVEFGLLGTTVNIKYSRIDKFLPGSEIIEDCTIPTQYDDLADIPVELEKGYKYVWKYEGEEIESLDDIELSQTTINLVCEITPITYDITYSYPEDINTTYLTNPNPTSYTVEKVVGFSELTLAKCDYHTFNGWQVYDEDLKEYVSIESTEGCYSELTVLCNVAPIEYTLKGIYTKQDVSPSIETIPDATYTIYTIDDNAILPFPDYSEYTFNGWYYTDTLEGDPVSHYSQLRDKTEATPQDASELELVLYGELRPNTCTLIIKHWLQDLDNNDTYTISEGDTSRSSEFYYGQKVKVDELSIKQIDGFTYDHPSSAEFYMTKEVTLNLYYTRNTYKVYMYGYNGDSTKAVITYRKFEELLDLPDNIESRGHTFQGWTYDSVGEQTIDETATMPAVEEGSLKVYAQFKANYYTLTYYADDKGSLYYQESVQYGQSISLNSGLTSDQENVIQWKIQGRYYNAGQTIKYTWITNVAAFPVFTPHPIRTVDYYYPNIGDSYRLSRAKVAENTQLDLVHSSQNAALKEALEKVNVSGTFIGCVTPNGIVEPSYRITSDTDFILKYLQEVQLTYDSEKLIVKISNSDHIIPSGSRIPVGTSVDAYLSSAYFDEYSGIWRATGYRITTDGSSSEVKIEKPLGSGEHVVKTSISSTTHIELVNEYNMIYTYIDLANKEIPLSTEDIWITEGNRHNIGITLKGPVKLPDEISTEDYIIEGWVETRSGVIYPTDEASLTISTNCTFQLKYIPKVLTCYMKNESNVTSMNLSSYQELDETKDDTKIYINPTTVSQNYVVENDYLTLGDQVYLKIFDHRIFINDHSSVKEHPEDYASRMFTNQDDAPQCFKHNKFSRLQDLNSDTFRSIAEPNCYEFILMYPDKPTKNYNHWRQTHNPLTYYDPSENTGYDPVLIQMDTCWSEVGIARSTSGSTLLDCQPDVGTWFGSVGQYVTWSDSNNNIGFPAPDDTAYPQVQLWVRIDNTKYIANTAIQNILNNRKVFYTDRFTEN